MPMPQTALAAAGLSRRAIIASLSVHALGAMLVLCCACTIHSLVQSTASEDTVILADAPAPVTAPDYPALLRDPAPSCAAKPSANQPATNLDQAWPADPTLPNPAALLAPAAQATLPAWGMQGPPGTLKTHEYLPASATGTGPALAGSALDGAAGVPAGHGANPFTAVHSGVPAPGAVTAGAGPSGGPPQPLAGNAPPTYPEAARRRHLQGTVRVVLTVLASGAVAHVELLHSSGHEVLDQSALAAVTRWRFAPQPQAPPRIVEQQFDFTLQDH